MSSLPPIQVTNNTAGPIQLLDSYQQSTGGAAPTASTPVTYTPLATIPAGQTQSVDILHASNHIVVTRNGPLTDTTGGTQVAFPVKVIAVLSIGQNRSFTVGTADQAAMEQTFKFVRYVSANPGSALTTAFLAALNDKNQTAAVNAFFAGTASFSSCTMVTWAAITAWQTDFLSAWQGSYYLYDASKDLKAMRLVAGVSVTLSGDQVQAQAWMADADGKWTMDSAHTPLAITAGHLSEVTPTPGLSVTLTPVWMNAVQTSASDTTSATTVIAPTMSGSVNGTPVLGNFKQMPTPKPGSSSSTASTSSVAAWLKQNINVGVLVSAGMLFIMYKQWQEAKNTKADAVVEKGKSGGDSDQKIADDVQASDAAVEAQAQADQAPVQAENAQAFEDFPQAEVEARAARAQADVQEAVEEQTDALETVLEEAPASPATDDVVNSLQSASDKADQGDVDGAWEDLGDVSTHLQTLVEQNESSMSTEAQEAAKSVQDDIQEATEQADAEQKAEQEQQDDSDKGPDDPVDDPGDVDPPEMDFPGGE